MRFRGRTVLLVDDILDEGVTLAEILDSVAANRERDIRVEVLRPVPGQQPTLINAVVHVIRAEEEADSSGVFQPANAPM